MIVQYCNYTWDEVVDQLADRPWRTRVRLEKNALPHPLAVGLQRSTGMPEGQIADYRWLLKNGVGLHVKDFGTHYEAHLDEVHPAVDAVEHLRQDAPEVYVGGAVVLGALVGGLVGRGGKGALVGAAFMGLGALFLAALAKQDDHTRPKPR